MIMKLLVKLSYLINKTFFIHLFYLHMFNFVLTDFMLRFLFWFFRLKKKPILLLISTNFFSVTLKPKRYTIVFYSRNHIDSFSSTFHFKMVYLSLHTVFVFVCLILFFFSKTWFWYFHLTKKKKNNEKSQFFGFAFHV